MGIGRILAAGSALGATGLLVAAPIALAAAPSVSVAKPEARPGSSVEIITECALSGKDRGPTADVLENVKRVSYDEKTLTAKWAATVKKDAKAGAYEISFLCQDKTVNAKLTVSAAGGATTEPTTRPSTPKPTTSTRPKPSTSTPTTTPKAPKGAPETGGGGTSDDGGNGLAIAGGAAALAAGAGFGVWALRRRRASAQG